jgi:hypothetical protein
LAAAHANVVAAKTIDAIVKQTLGSCGAKKTIVILALVFPVARAIRAIVVRIGVVFDRPANTIDAAAFFRGATRHAFVIAFAIATKPIDTITRRALCT